MLACSIYRLAARLSALLLGTSGCLQSVLVHRSVATGEVVFGRSDIDLLVVLRPGVTGARLARLYQGLRLLQKCNPALTHLELFRPGQLEELARRDTVFGSMERRSMRLLYGEPVTLAPLPVEPQHALRKFLLWCEVFLAVALHQRNARNLHKIALECWNYYAVAQGLQSQPWLLRSEMQRHLPGSHSQLHTPQGALSFVLELARQLHGSRLPPLTPLRSPLIFNALLPPYCFQRRFVVLPEPQSPLPSQVFEPGAFAVTPELLHLYAHYKNGFLHGLLPQTLLNLGMQPPKPAGFTLDLLHYCDPRALFFPGFADRRAPHPAARLACLQHAWGWLKRDLLPPPLEPAGLQSWVLDIVDYYRTSYEPLQAQSDQLELEILAGLGLS